MKPKKRGEVSGVLIQVIVFLIVVLVIAFIFLPILFPMIKTVFSYNESDEEAKELAKTIEQIINDRAIVQEFKRYLVSKNRENESILLFYSGLTGYNLRIRKENQNNYLILSRVSKPIRSYGLSPNSYFPLEKPIDLACQTRCYINITINKKGEIFLEKGSFRK